MAVKLRSKLVHIEGVKWTGKNAKEIEYFLQDCPAEFTLNDRDEWLLKVWNFLEEQWINVPVGHWVLRGLKDEFYPCEEEALFMKYEVVEDA